MASSTTLVVTRPSGQATGLIEALGKAIGNLPIDQHPGAIVSLPLLTIAPKSDPALPAVIRSALHTADLAVFVSPNAIECAMRLLGDAWQSLNAQSIPIGVVGQSSRDALNRHGVGIEALNPTPIWMPSNPEKWDSEGLWGAIQDHFSSWAGRKIVLFRGDGGREWLVDQLQAVGAVVEVIPVYSRIPLIETSPLWDAVFSINKPSQAAKDEGIDTPNAFWILTSSEAVRHLGAVIKQQDHNTYLSTATALCPHPNIAALAKEIGFATVLQCHSGDAALVKAIVTWLEAGSKKPR